ncbi:ATP/GTP-binding protein [Novosphingobium sp. IK01]|uniref:ATP/GTP-binding protein n=2 Tax=Novosphingobium pituita TaxID=3056842 RepID=A0ABQ6P650_9SPHN|nr:ATP/GTP-binding protein [Novosphingobium sp. IK01]
MLLRFTVQNAYCFGAESVLSMVATNDDRHPSHVTQGPDGRPNSLRLAALYGANGHGKTNLVRAISALQDLVAEQKWSVPRFKLDPDLGKEPTRMVIEFRQGEFDYEYGVVVNGKIVSEEWLFRTDGSGKEILLFERTSKKNNDSFETSLVPGDSLKREPSPVKGLKMSKYLEVLSAGLKENRPFLSELDERKIPLLDPAYEWITKKLVTITATSNYAPLFDRVGRDEEFRKFLEGFLRRCDVGISNLSSRTIKLDSAFSEKLPDHFMQQISSMEADECLHVKGDDGISFVLDRDANGEIAMRSLEAVRLDTRGEKVEFSFDEESSGTRRMLDLAPMIADPKDDRVYVVDELDRKLHPMLSYRFVEEFLRKGAGQLVLTTHNTHLMDLDLLRRDEIWFIQKRPDGSSDLYSLAEMKIRPDLNVRKGYINGRFGAIPFLGNPDAMVEC